MVSGERGEGKKKQLNAPCITLEIKSIGSARCVEEKRRSGSYPRNRLINGVSGDFEVFHVHRCSHHHTDSNSVKILETILEVKHKHKHTHSA